MVSPFSSLSILLHSFSRYRLSLSVFAKTNSQDLKDENVNWLNKYSMTEPLTKSSSPSEWTLVHIRYGRVSLEQERERERERGKLPSGRLFSLIPFFFFSFLSRFPSQEWTRSSCPFRLLFCTWTISIPSMLPFLPFLRPSHVLLSLHSQLTKKYSTTRSSSSIFDQLFHTRNSIEFAFAIRLPFVSTRQQKPLVLCINGSRRLTVCVEFSFPGLV